MKKRYYALLLLLGILCLVMNNKTTNADELIYKEVTASQGDTSTELQALLDTNKNGNYNLKVIVPAGEYILNKEIRMFSNTTLQADQNAKFIKNHQRGPMISNDLIGDQGGYNTTKNITIIGGIWDSSRVATLNKGTESLRFIHATGVTIEQATITNVPNGSHMITFAGVKNGTIKNCTLYGYGGTMLKEAIQLDIVHDNIVVPSMQETYLTYDDLPCNNILITGCNIYDYSRAIGSHTSVEGVFHQNITIENNTLHDLLDTAIKAYNYKNLKVSNNTIYNVSMGILVYTYINNEEIHYLKPLTTTTKEPLPTNYNIFITGNTLYDINESKTQNTASKGDAIRTIGSTQRPLSGVTISDNIIKNTKRYGIFLEGTSSSTIANNSITSTLDTGIYAISGSHNAKIMKNTLVKNGSFSKNTGGIAVNASKKATIQSNSITSSGKNGISLYSKSNEAVISNNTITSPGENGIATYTQSNTSKINSNTIKNYRLNGIFLYGSKSATITSNKVYGKTTGNGKNGIHISGDKSKSCKFVVASNYIKTSLRHGIYVEFAPNTSIYKNTIINATKTPIFLDKTSTKSKLTSNKITTTKK